MKVYFSTDVQLSDAADAVATTTSACTVDMTPAVASAADTTTAAATAVATAVATAAATAVGGGYS